ATDGIVHRRTRQRVAQRAVDLRLLAGGRMAERDVAVQRRMLEARGRLDGRDDLARDAQLRERAEGRVLVRAVCAHRLEQADLATVPPPTENEDQGDNPSMNLRLNIKFNLRPGSLPDQRRIVKRPASARAEFAQVRL